MNDGLKSGEWVEVEIFKITNFGAFVKLPNGGRGLIHISQVADAYVKDINEFIKVGDKVKARIINTTPDGKIDLSLKNPSSAIKRDAKPSIGRANFEEKLKAFLKQSEERQSDLKRNLESKLG